MSTARITAQPSIHGPPRKGRVISRQFQRLQKPTSVLPGGTSHPCRRSLAKPPCPDRASSSPTHEEAGRSHMQNLPGPTLSLGLLCPLPAPSMVAATGRRPHPSARLHVAGLSQPASRTWWASHMPSTTSDIQSQGGFAQQWNWSPGPSLYVTGSLTGQQDLPIER